MLNIQIERLENGKIRVYSLYTKSVIGRVDSFLEAQEIARNHIRKMSR